MRTHDTAHAARKRLVTGIAVLACTFFYAFAPTCGLLGQLISRGSATLLGQTGSLLLAVTLFLIGTVMVIPVGGVGRLVRWAQNGREARVRGVARELEASVSKAELKRIAKALRAMAHEEEDGDGIPHPVAPAPGEPVPTELAPTDRMKLDDLRGALKGLGYKPHEFEKFVAGMDPARSLDNLIRDALGALKGKPQPTVKAN